jgi:hypothetical protein
LHKTHINELSNELQDTLKNVTRHNRTLQVLCTLAQHLNAFISGTSLPPPGLFPQMEPPEEQRVIPATTPNQPPIQMVMTAPPSLLASNPMAPRVLPTKQRMHQ